VKRGVLLNRIGRHMNTLKIRPPMPFSKENTDQMIDVIKDALAATPVPA
jgi:4-aminobutyrate aminotransferase-like enzyme